MRGLRHYNGHHLSRLMPSAMVDADGFLADERQVKSIQ